MNQSLRSLRFRAEREATWTRLDALLTRVEQRSARSLSDEDILAIPALYRSTLSSLSVARATSLDQALVTYLEALSARAYFFVYGSRQTLMERTVEFFAVTWPTTIRAMWRETIATTLLTTISAVVAYFLVRNDASYFFAFVPEAMAGGRDPNATAEQLRQTLYAQDPNTDKSLGVFATFLFTHNAQIALFGFALGIAFCLPSALLIAYNGAVLGALWEIFAARGLAVPFGGWVLIHGVTELFAIIIAGAAGIRIGWSLAFPGSLSRLQAAERAGREGGVAMLGVVLMLMVAGLLEGFARQLVLQDSVRFAVAALSGIFWISYFYIPRRTKAVGR